MLFWCLRASGLCSLCKGNEIAQGRLPQPHCYQKKTQNITPSPGPPAGCLLSALPGSEAWVCGLGPMDLWAPRLCLGRSVRLVRGDKQGHGHTTCPTTHSAQWPLPYSHLSYPRLLCLWWLGTAIFPTTGTRAKGSVKTRGLYAGVAGWVELGLRLPHSI